MEYKGSSVIHEGLGRLRSQYKSALAANLSSCLKVVSSSNPSTLFNSNGLTYCQLGVFICLFCLFVSIYLSILFIHLFVSKM